MYQTLEHILRPYISFQIISNCLKVKIETERLFIHSYNDNDFENCVSLYSNELITKYFDHGKARTRLEIKKLIREKGNKYFLKCKPFGLFSIFYKECMTFIGQIDLLPSDESGVVEIGFILHEKYHNQGFCTEAVKAFIFSYVDELNARNFESDDLPINKIIATVHPENIPSRNVLQKCGMTLDKIQDRFSNPRLWYSIPTSLDMKHQKIEEGV